MLACYNSSCAVPSTGDALSNFYNAVQFFAAAQCLSAEGTYKESEIKEDRTYDFIIVGGGSTGCVLANRLSEVKDWDVLLIEAGGDPPLEASIPGLASSVWFPPTDWGYITAKNGITNEGNLDEAIYWPRGKMLGGSSNSNYMTYIEGNKKDYESWCDEGNKEWCLEDIIRCFKKSVNMRDKRLNKVSSIYQHYGHDGLLMIDTFNATYRNNSEQILSSFNEINIKNVPDLNVADVLGSGIARSTASNGERNSVSKAYLKPAMNRKNLHIKKNSMVTNILINTEKKAYGVVAEYNGKKREIYATKDIIVSAGSVNSPILLMHAGIGPTDHLSAKNITTVIDLAKVGQDLQDHLVIPICICTNETYTTTEADEKLDIFKYIYNREGNLAATDAYDIFAFYSLDSNATYPDFEIYVIRFIKNSSTLNDFLVKSSRYKDVVANSIMDLNKNYTLYMFFVSLLHPYSRGNISLSSNDPNEAPQIFPNYLTDERDLNTVVAGAEKLLSILYTTFYKSVGGFHGRIKFPKCDKYKISSKRYLKCIAVNLLGTDYHPIGTCKMGSNRNNSVVSSRLNVHGISNLRVVDASIMPSHISGNINGPCVMIGERAAEIIKEDYKNISKQ